MQRINKLAQLAIVTMVGAWAGAAAAEDPSRRTPAQLAPAPTWAGFYAGAHVGYGRSASSGSLAVDPGALLAQFPGVNLVTSTATAPFTVPLDPKGWLGGFQAGYNWQSGYFVYGMEGDISFSGIKAEGSGSYTLRPVYLVGDFDNYAGTVTAKASVDYFGTIRGRLGFANDTWLVYATGGYAWAHTETSLYSSHERLTNNLLIPNFPAALNGQASSSGIRSGYAVGGGLEWKLAPHWTVKAEYLYIDVDGSATLSIPGATYSDELALHTVRVGFNWRLDP